MVYGCLCDGQLSSGLAVADIRSGWVGAFRG